MVAAEDERITEHGAPRRAEEAHRDVHSEAAFPEVDDGDAADLISPTVCVEQLADAGADEARPAPSYWASWKSRC
jgi:hypothetical protein